MRTLLLLSFLCACAAPAAARPVAPPSPDFQDRVTRAIVDAVEQRMGAGAQVIVERLAIFSQQDSAQIEAVPAPGARTGTLVSFALVGVAGTGAARRAVTIGRADALVHVAVPHAKATRLITRGTEVGADDLTSSDEDVRDAPLRRLPTLGQLLGGHALKNMAAGEVATGAAITAMPAVRSGQIVRATAPIAGAEVSAMVIAAQNGELGAIIRVVNRDSQRQLRARVIGEGLVEVIHD